ncbi:uncharacterized membrane protein (DUF4010 family) [Tibeticola sediminis]|jgi:uncharacterized membrane protein (DUF4010 family)|uniref:Uncharacterized membrane protein (DUF4010 family) n=1 Tax=Tibeticola sediminis TaxID=1917811 RepID=A0A3N4UA01_9BURK|nr:MULTISPECIES: MgtC/SapB family protein [Tibeticola]MCI4440510.1 MgtC/SapB family protein [Tibeticola sp.]RPE67556.1 uncharacterized membrane protein (DUF4010 family) [Tibeticola sediminis]
MNGIGSPDFLHAVALLAAALGCGLLVGVERERRKGDGASRRPAGLRTFAITSVMGAAGMLAGGVFLALVGALLVAALVVVAYGRDRGQDPGITTELALMLTYFIGVLCTVDPALASALAVALTALLAAREPLHRFARQWLTEGEVRDGIILAALLLVALPVVPDRPLWGPVLNPHVLLKLLALMLAVQALGHLARRLLRARQALVLSAVSAGFVSSTATIAQAGLVARAQAQEPAVVRTQAAVGVLSCVATMVQLLLVAGTVQPSWVRLLALPALAGAGFAAFWGMWLLRGTHTQDLSGVESGPLPPSERMFSLPQAAGVAVALTGVTALTQAARAGLGDAGLWATTLLAALFELHSAVAAVLAQGPAPVSAQDAHFPLLWAVLGALTVHGLAKSVVAAVSGGWVYARAALGGLLGHTAVFVGLLAWLGGVFG